jgi:hypothetical protein
MRHLGAPLNHINTWYSQGLERLWVNSQDYHFHMSFTTFVFGCIITVNVLI